MITVETRMIGQRKPVEPDWGLPLPPELAERHESLTLRQLISTVVRREVQAFRERQAERQTLRVLTEQQIAEGVARGKVTMGGQEFAPQEVDEEQAIGVALQAFEDGLYAVIIDREQQHDLDRVVAIGPDSRVTFLRLVAFAGG